MTTISASPASPASSASSASSVYTLQCVNTSNLCCKPTPERADAGNEKNGEEIKSSKIKPNKIQSQNLHFHARSSAAGSFPRYWPPPSMLLPRLPAADRCTPSARQKLAVRLFRIFPWVSCIFVHSSAHVCGATRDGLRYGLGIW